MQVRINGHMLEEYNQKRDFKKTGEPEGRPGGTEGLLRFVVQHHSARADHYDLRLEWEGVMLSWAVPKGPSYDTRDKRLAVETEAHPLEYSDFEGTIPKDEYGGGVVMIWDEGFWEPWEDTGKGLEKGDLKFILHGKRLKGKWVLVRMKADERGRKNWLLIKEKDEYALDNSGISAFAASVRTGRTMEEILQGKDEIKNEAKNPFNSIDVQLAKFSDWVPEGEGWIYEIKFDGYRITAYIDGGVVRLETRNGKDYSDKFRDVAQSLKAWAGERPMVLDGEMVVLDAEGKSDFQALQNYLKSPKGHELTYMVFDLLALDGADMRRSRLIDRKNKLDALMRDSPGNIRFSSHITGSGREFFLAACNAGLEGIIGKKADSPYGGARNGDWIKIKCGSEQEFVIGGYTQSGKKSIGISSILLGVYEGGDLVFAGRAGTGFTVKTAKDLEERFSSIISPVPPFRDAPKPKKGEAIYWLKPDMAAQIRFAEWTGDNVLRQASFKGIRDDKDPKTIKREDRKSGSGAAAAPENDLWKEKQMEAKRMSVNIEGVRISSPDKAMYEDPEITKAEVAGYYSKVAERMLPYAAGRILSIIRCPDGISSQCFYKKHPGPGDKGIVEIPVKGKGGDEKNYFYIENIYGLISEVQMGTIEFHTWGSRAENLELPDMMVFDLDPEEGLDLSRVREGVKDLKRILDELSLVSFLKTSGGKGYHIVIPLMPSVGWDAFSAFAKSVAEVMERRGPDRYTSNMRKDQRKGKIFIDWVRNSRSATSVAAYSLRARKGAPVSMPVSWEELDIVAPDGINIKNAAERLNGEDPWKDFLKITQRIKGEKM